MTLSIAKKQEYIDLSVLLSREREDSPSNS